MQNFASLYKLFDMATVFKSIHPFDQSPIEEFPIMTPSEIQATLDRSSKAFKNWRRTSFSGRSALMLNVASLLRKNKETYARHITLEMGKVITEARVEVEKCAAG